MEGTPSVRKTKSYSSVKSSSNKWGGLWFGALQTEVKWPKQVAISDALNPDGEVLTMTSRTDKLHSQVVDKYLLNHPNVAIRQIDRTRLGGDFL